MKYPPDPCILGLPKPTPFEKPSSKVGQLVLALVVTFSPPSKEGVASVQQDGTFDKSLHLQSYLAHQSNSKNNNSGNNGNNSDGNGLPGS